MLLYSELRTHFSI